VPLLFGIIVAAVVIFAIFAVTIGHGGSMTQFKPDWPGRQLPEDRTVRAQDLAEAQFSLAFRGYRMAEVDEALDRLAVEIAERDEQIERLTGEPFESVRPNTPAPATAEPVAQEPVAQEPVAQEPVARESFAQEPFAQEATVPDYSTPAVDRGGPSTQPIPPVVEPGPER
jgi:DivIVA domain-containing protein